MPISVVVIMDPISTIKVHKDSTFAMLLEVQRRGWEILYAEQNHLHARDGRTFARLAPLQVQDDPEDWFNLGAAKTMPLDTCDVILMRKDPPFDMEYIYTTYLLDQPAEAGVLVVNHPAALRNANEKLAATLFPQVCAPVLVTRDSQELNQFIVEQGDVILKPLEGMGGASIFRVRQHDPNRNVIIETLTAHNTRFTMAQRFIPEISEGDKRILVIDGEPVPYALARIPAAGETRGNLAVGGSGVGVELSDRDFLIVETVSPYLREQGILFAGLDVIGDYLTEINITSPTCIRELDSIYNLNIAANLMDCIERKLAV
jgi:glutathione synthase